MSEPLAALAADVARHGVAHAFGVPGGGASLTLIDALARRDVTFHSTAHEGAAAVMAGTHGRLTGRAGVAIAIKGPGLANMLPGMAACMLESWPMVAMAEAYGPGVTKAHKRMDHAALAAGVGKAHVGLSSDGLVFADIAAFAEAETPAPVLLDLVARPSALPDAVAPAASLPLDAVAAAERPLVIAGTMAVRAGWSDRLNALRLPVFSTAAAKGVVDETLPHAAGVYTGVGLARSPEASLVARADLIVGLGLRDAELLNGPAFDAPFVNVETPSADAVFDLLDGRPWGVDAAVAATGALRRSMLDDGFLPAHALRALAAAFPDGVRVVIDTGYFCTIAEHAWQAPRADWCLSSGSGRYMGIGLAQAVGAALIDDSVPTVLLTGDGGIGPFFAEARLAAEARRPLAVLHMSDGGYGSVRTRAVSANLTQAPLLFEGRGWRAAFDGIGFATARAGGEDALAAALAGWRATEAPLFVELPFDPDAYQAMVAGLR